MHISVQEGPHSTVISCRNNDMCILNRDYGKENQTGDLTSRYFIQADCSEMVSAIISIHVLCENTSLLPPTLLQSELIEPCAPSFHSVDVIFSRVQYDFFLCLLNGACVPRHFYLFQKIQTAFAAPLIISRIV